MKEYHYYDQEGNLTVTSEQNDQVKVNACCLKIISEETPGNTHVYIKMDSGGFFDPAQKRQHKSKFRVWKFKHVRQEAFDLYVRYLQSKHHYLFLNAQRVN